MNKLLTPIVLSLVLILHVESANTSDAKVETTIPSENKPSDPQCKCEDEIYTDSLTTLLYKIPAPDPALCARPSEPRPLYLLPFQRELGEQFAKQIQQRTQNNPSHLPPMFRSLASAPSDADKPLGFPPNGPRDENQIVISALPSEDTLPSDCYIQSLKQPPNVRRRRCTNAITHPDVKGPVRSYDSDETEDKNKYPPIPFCGDKPRDTTKLVTETVCPNTRYVQLIKDAFEETMKCLDVDPKEMFPFINHESHFRINALSESGVTCIGQVSTSAIEYQNRSPSHFQHIKKNCPNVHKFFSPIDIKLYKKTDSNGKEELTTGFADSQESGDINKCNLVENPYSCLVYAALTYKTNQKLIEKITAEEAKGKNYFQYPKAITELIVAWSYNGGSGGIGALYKTFLEEITIFKENGIVKEALRSALHNVCKEESAEKSSKNCKSHESLANSLIVEMQRFGGMQSKRFKNLFSQYILLLHKTNLKDPNEIAKRRGEVAGYVNKLQEDMVKVVSKNRQCGNSRSVISGGQKK